jgi:Amt family ammonium transporter
MAMWTLVEWLHRGKPTTLGAASGAIAGLATITPAAGFVGPNAAVLIGFLAGAGCYLGVTMKGRFGYDDSLDVVGIHGLGGIIGTICLGIFASKLINPAGADGLLAGNPGFLGTQIFGVVVVGIYAFALSWVLLKAIDVTMGLRLPVDAEVSGLDLSEHSETAYS